MDAGVAGEPPPWAPPPAAAVPTACRPPPTLSPTGGRAPGGAAHTGGGRQRQALGATAAPPLADGMRRSAAGVRGAAVRPPPSPNRGDPVALALSVDGLARRWLLPPPACGDGWSETPAAVVRRGLNPAGLPQAAGVTCDQWLWDGSGRKRFYLVVRAVLGVGCRGLGGEPGG